MPQFNLNKALWGFISGVLSQGFLPQGFYLRGFISWVFSQGFYLSVFSSRGFVSGVLSQFFISGVFISVVLSQGFYLGGFISGFFISGFFLSQRFSSQWFYLRGCRHARPRHLLFHPCSRGRLRTKAHQDNHQIPSSKIILSYQSQR